MARFWAPRRPPQLRNAFPNDDAPGYLLHDRDTMVLLPREHGAYGQLIFPLVTSLIVSGASAAAALIVVCVVACFLAHESLLVLLGHRGPRVRSEQACAATVWLVLLGAVAAVTGALATAWLPSVSRWFLLAPAIPAVAVGAAVLAGKEKTAAAEVGVALAFSSAALPVGVAAGAPVSTAASVATTFAAAAVLATLAVRSVILRSRGGGDPAAAQATRRVALVLAAVVPAAIAAACAVRLLPWTALAALMPGVGVALFLVLFPPRATRLRPVGWSLFGMLVVTAGVLVAGLRVGPGA